MAAAGSLVSLGAVIEVLQSSAQFHSATGVLAGHGFTVQVVQDPPLFAVGSSSRAGDAVVVADLPTLSRMKAATLGSRCSESDLSVRLSRVRCPASTGLRTVSVSSRWCDRALPTARHRPAYLPSPRPGTLILSSERPGAIVTVPTSTNFRATRTRTNPGPAGSGSELVSSAPGQDTETW